VFYLRCGPSSSVSVTPGLKGWFIDTVTDFQGMNPTGEIEIANKKHVYARASGLPGPFAAWHVNFQHNTVTFHGV